MEKKDDSKTVKAEQLCVAASQCVVNKAYVEAKHLYKQACRIDPTCANALNALGELYVKGQGVLFGLRMTSWAEDYFQRAQRAGSPMAAFNLGLLFLERAKLMWKRMKHNPTRADYDRVYQAFYKAWAYFADASAQISLANYHLADFELFGLARSRNSERAASLYKIAARGGHECAKAALENLSSHQWIDGSEYRKLAEHFEWREGVSRRQEGRGPTSDRSFDGYDDGTESSGGGVSHQ